VSYSKIALIYLLFASTFSIALLPEHTLVALTAEDGLVESYGALAFFIAAVFFWVAWSRSEGFGNRLGRIHFRKNAAYLLLAVLFFFAAGEEISWGQRLFGWATPESLAEINRQGETNIHNLAPFQHGAVIDIYLFFNLFWIGLCVGVPLLALAQPIRQLFERLGVPVTQLWIGGLMLGSYLVFKLVAQSFEEGDARHGLNELKEANTAAGLALMALFEMIKVARAGREEAPDEQAPIAGLSTPERGLS
jgi:hypothetical protein